MAAKQPKILFIVADDIGWMQPTSITAVGDAHHRRIGNEGAIFMEYLGMQSCTSGRCACITGMYPAACGIDPAATAGQPILLRQGTPGLAEFLRDLGYATGQFGKNHLGDHAESLPTAHGFQELLWLPLSPGRDATVERPGHQQEPDPADCRAAVQNHTVSGMSSGEPSATSHWTACLISQSF
jgi:arylsulfatase A-like enzyme